eukprot:tig00000144_g9181.t1
MAFTGDMQGGLEKQLVEALARAESANPASLVDASGSRLSPAALARALKIPALVELAVFVADGRVWDVAEPFEPVWYMRKSPHDAAYAMEYEDDEEMQSDAFFREVNALLNGGALGAVADVVEKEEAPEEVRSTAGACLARIAASRAPGLLSRLLAGRQLFAPLLRLLDHLFRDRPGRPAGAGKMGRHLAELMEAVVLYGEDGQAERATAEPAALAPFVSALRCFCTDPVADVVYPGPFPPEHERLRLAASLAKLSELFLWGDSNRVGGELPTEEGVARQARALEASGALQAMGEVVVEIAKSIPRIAERDIHYASRALFDLLKTLEKALVRCGSPAARPSPPPSGTTGTTRAAPSQTSAARDRSRRPLTRAGPTQAFGGLRNYKMTFDGMVAELRPRPAAPAAAPSQPPAANGPARPRPPPAEGQAPAPVPAPRAPMAAQGAGGRGSGLVRGFFNR